MYLGMQPGRTTESTTSSPLCTRTLRGKRLSARLPSSVQVAQAAAPRTRRVPARACRNMPFVRCVSAPGPDRSAAAQLVSMAGQPAPLTQRLQGHAGWSGASAPRAPTALQQHRRAARQPVPLAPASSLSPRSASQRSLK